MTQPGSFLVPNPLAPPPDWGLPFTQESKDSMDSIGAPEPLEQNWLFRIVESKCFSVLGLAVIIVNTIFVIVRADNEAKVLEDSVFFFWADAVFTLYYAIECGLKLCAYGCDFWSGHESAWNIFDFVLVCIAVLDFVATESSYSSILRNFRIFKVVRTVRVLRVVKILRELRTMLFVVVKSMGTLFWSMCLLLFVLLPYALVFVQAMTMFRQDNPDMSDDPDTVYFFGSVTSAMTGLFQCSTGGVDWGKVYDLVTLHSVTWGLLFQSFIVVFQVAVFNVITSIYVDKARKLGQPGDDELIDDMLQEEQEEKNSLRQLISRLDSDDSGSLSYEEVLQGMKQPEIVRLFDHFGIRIRDVKLFFRALGTTQRSDVPLDAFVDGCMKLKGSATSLDMQAMKFLMRRQHDMLHKLAAHLRMNDLTSGHSLVSGMQGSVLI